MSAEHDRVRRLAERIAERVSQTGTEENASPSASSSAETDEMASVRESLAELKRKLAAIEEHLLQDKDNASSESRYNQRRESRDNPQQDRPSARPQASVQSPWLSGMYVPATHPSQERFGVEEAAVSELVDYFEKEKVCELEPGGKPCTHCDMCSTRGF